jgi:hypothetical protein
LPLDIGGVISSIPIRVSSAVIGSPGHIEIEGVTSLNGIYDSFYSANNAAAVPSPSN